MKLIDARERFERKRAASAFGGWIALDGIARDPEAIDIRTLRRYRDARLESEHLMAQVDELNSWAARLPGR